MQNINIPIANVDVSKTVIVDTLSYSGDLASGIPGGLDTIYSVSLSDTLLNVRVRSTRVANNPINVRWELAEFY